MGDTDNTTEQKSIDAGALQKVLENLTSVTFHEIGIDHHSTKSKRSLQLLGNKDTAKAITSRREWFGYEFKELIYLSSVEVSTEGFGEFDEFDLSYVDSFTKIEKLLYAKAVEGKVKFAVGRFVEGFGFRPPSKYLVSPKLLSIDAYGLKTDEINLLVDQFVQVASIRDRVMRECQIPLKQAADAESRKVTLEGEISSLETKLETITKSIEDADADFQSHEAKLKDKVKEVEAANSVLAEKQTTISTFDDQIEKKTEERKGLNQEVVLANNKLSELKRDIHLFPSEIAGYVKQGARNIWLYVLLSLVPFGLIFAVTVKLFLNSEHLVDAFLANPTLPVIDYLLSRLPYALVSAVILVVCYTWLHRLFSEIITINRRKQDLLKISIIATDVSFASQHGLDLNEEDSYNLRTQNVQEQ